MSAYFLHGSLTATAGNGQKLAEILLKASELVSTAKGCSLYLISQDAAAPETVWITEVWDSQANHDESLNVPGVRALIGQAMPILAGPPQKGQELAVSGGFGLNL